MDLEACECHRSHHLISTNTNNTCSVGVIGLLKIYFQYSLDTFGKNYSETYGMFFFLNILQIFSLSWDFGLQSRWQCPLSAAVRPYSSPCFPSRDFGAVSHPKSASPHSEGPRIVEPKGKALSGHSIRMVALRGEDGASSRPKVPRGWPGRHLTRCQLARRRMSLWKTSGLWMVTFMLSEVWIRL